MEFDKLAFIKYPQLKFESLSFMNLQFLKVHDFITLTQMVLMIKLIFHSICLSVALSGSVEVYVVDSIQ